MEGQLRPASVGTNILLVWVLPGAQAASNAATSNASIPDEVIAFYSAALRKVRVGLLAPVGVGASIEIARPRDWAGLPP